MKRNQKIEKERELKKAMEKLSALFDEQEELAIRIARQQRRVAAFATLIDESEETESAPELNLGGLSDAVRSVLRAAGATGLTPKEVRGRLTELYFPINRYQNFMASLHVVLNRLVHVSKEARIAIRDVHDGKNESVYQWIFRFPRESKFRRMARKLVKD